MLIHQAQQKCRIELRPVFEGFVSACLLLALMSSCGCHAGFNSLFESKTGVTTFLFRHSDHVSVEYAGISESDMPILEELQKLVSSKDYSKFDASFEQFASLSIEFNEFASQSAASSTEFGSETNAHQQSMVRAIYESKLLRGISQADRGLFSEAESVFDKLLEERPDDWRVLLHRWQLKAKQGDDAGAKADRERGMALHPEVFSREYSHVSGVI